MWCYNRPIDVMAANGLLAWWQNQSLTVAIGRKLLADCRRNGKLCLIATESAKPAGWGFVQAYSHNRCVSFGDVRGSKRQMTDVTALAAFLQANVGTGLDPRERATVALDLASGLLRDDDAVIALSNQPPNRSADFGENHAAHVFPKRLEWIESRPRATVGGAAEPHRCKSTSLHACRVARGDCNYWRFGRHLIAGNSGSAKRAAERSARITSSRSGWRRGTMSGRRSSTRRAAGDIRGRAIRIKAMVVRSRAAGFTTHCRFLRKRTSTIWGKA